MNEDTKNFCPTWLFKLISAVTVYDYVVKDKAMFFSLKKFDAYLKKNYRDIDTSEIESTANFMLSFLGELKIDENTYLLISHYMHDIILDIKPTEKGIFKSDPYEGTKKKEYSIEESVQEFKAFCYSCRSGLTRKAPKGWDIYKEEDLGKFQEVLASDFGLDDMIDNLIT
ncbi:MAG: hypothetical protein CMN01_02875 [Rickettsiales bacterium]|nr:hypothetical protein [Rickettsiales bacterium]MBC33551.1 hypothetical protein [Rickettsiales bacterium]